MVPALHRKYVQSMVGMFGDCALHGASEWPWPVSWGARGGGVVGLGGTIRGGGDVGELQQRGFVEGQTPLIGVSNPFWTGV